MKFVEGEKVLIEAIYKTGCLILGEPQTTCLYYHPNLKIHRTPNFPPGVEFYFKKDKSKVYTSLTQTEDHVIGQHNNHSPVVMRKSDCHRVEE